MAWRNARVPRRIWSLTFVYKRAGTFQYRLRFYFRCITLAVSQYIGFTYVLCRGTNGWLWLPYIGETYVWDLWLPLIPEPGEHIFAY